MRRNRVLPLVLSSRDVQVYRERVLAGETLTQADLLRLISSHEQARAVALVQRQRAGDLARENDSYLTALKKKDA